LCGVLASFLPTGRNSTLIDDSAGADRQTNVGEGTGIPGRIAVEHGDIRRSADGERSIRLRTVKSA
jgi:hypothetical protein